jgi:superfamily I DNA/RNA helicase
MDLKQERKKDLDTILISDHARRVVVAGPGTGKSFLFQEAIKRARKEGKNSFLAITFIGKLGDALADDLAGLADTVTLHGFARKVVLENCPKGWEYYPKIFAIIQEDLAFNEIGEFEIGDSSYKTRTKYYKSVGENDVVHYALQTLKNDKNKIPRYDLVLVDEFQDFNEIEAQLIDLLAETNKVLIVGDDDQALYQFKGSSPKYIRERYDAANEAFESHTLRFCSRCTPVIVKAFHDIVKNAALSAKGQGRINKEYICYLPEKEEDGVLNPKILLLKGAKPGAIPKRIFLELRGILESQKIKSVLVIGEGRSCQHSLLEIANRLSQLGFKNVDHRSLSHDVFTLKHQIIDGYKFISGGKNELLGWRILLGGVETAARKEIILKSYDNPNSLVQNLPIKFRKEHEKYAETLRKILDKAPSVVRKIADSTVRGLMQQVVEEKMPDREIFVRELVDENRNLNRPLGSLDITVCNILGSKGLGADVVFLIGFDQGKLPSKDVEADSEIYQMLVALTRAKKRIYLINTVGVQASKFINYIDSECCEEI